MKNNRYVVEVLCSGMGYAQTKYGGDTLSEAQQEEDKILGDDSVWVNPSAPRQTRVRDTLMGTTHSRAL